MALEGTLQDFGIAEILQKIDESRRTGILTIYSGEDTVTVTFLEGSIVAATNTEKRPEDRLGNFLVIKGYVTEEGLKKALSDQEQSFDRLGQILLKKRLIDKETLQTALREQVAQIVKRLLGLNQGFYHFKVEDKVHYDQENMVPLRVDAILISGFEEDEKVEQLIKEFPSVHTKYTKTRKADEHIIRELKMHGDLIAATGRPRSQPGVRLDGPMLEPFDKRVLKTLETPHSIQDLLSEFSNNRREVLESMKRFLSYDFIKEFEEKDLEIDEEEPLLDDYDDFYDDAEQTNLLALIPFLLAPLVIIGALLLGANPLRPFQSMPSSAFSDYQRIAVSQQANRLLTAIRMYVYEHRGQTPLTLDELVLAGYIDAADLTDPYGTDYRYELDGFAQICGIISAGPDGEFSADLNEADGDDIKYAAMYGEFRNPPGVFFPPTLGEQKKLLDQLLKD